MEIKHVLPGDIEKTSMGIIEKELEEKGIVIPEENKAVVKRVIHTSADFDYADTMTFTDDAVKRITAILKEKNVTFVTDTNMALSGISGPALAKLGCEKKCFMAEPEIATAAKAAGTTRAVASVNHMAENLSDVGFVCGNAPTALIELSKLMEEGFRPLFVVGIPVGFVNVVESKELILETCKKYDVPAIVALGRKGGSNVAAAICNALLYTATDTIDPSKRGVK